MHRAFRAVLLGARAGGPRAGTRLGGAAREERCRASTVEAALRGAEIPVRQDPGATGTSRVSVVAEGSETIADGAERGAGERAARRAGVGEVPGVLHDAVRNGAAV